MPEPYGRDKLKLFTVVKMMSLTYAQLRWSMATFKAGRNKNNSSQSVKSVCLLFTASKLAKLFKNKPKVIIVHNLCIFTKKQRNKELHWDGNSYYIIGHKVDLTVQIFCKSLDPHFVTIILWQYHGGALAELMPLTISSNFISTNLKCNVTALK